MKISEITESHDIEVLSESLDSELKELVKQQGSDPLNNLTITVAKRLKVWASEVLHTLTKGVDTEKVSFRTLKAIINDPVRFANQIIAHEIKKYSVTESGKQ